MRSVGLYVMLGVLYLLHMLVTFLHRSSPHILTQMIALSWKLRPDMDKDVRAGVAQSV
jgi:hypothetical protein